MIELAVGMALWLVWMFHWLVWMFHAARVVWEHLDAGPGHLL